ncbi:MAG: LamG-like jellyroll fold domain-containing protein [Opitutaceae bacterium]
MKQTHLICRLACVLAAVTLVPCARSAETVAFWAFDEPVGMYPSSVLSDQGPEEFTLALGLGGSVVPGRFGNALAPLPQLVPELPEGSVLFGLTQLPTPPDRTVPPMSWMNARFAALMTRGERHLRQEFEYANVTQTGVNLGDFDWTVEFWLYPQSWGGTDRDGVVFEIGEGPRGENDRLTALILRGDRTGFVLLNQPTDTEVVLPSDAASLREPGRWIHLAFVYDAGRRQMSHFVNGRLQERVPGVRLKSLAEGEEAYFSLLRDGLWNQPLPGSIDELRFSRGLRYGDDFQPPGSLVGNAACGQPELEASIIRPLLFGSSDQSDNGVLDLGNRKHLLIDDALFSESRNVEFRPNPPEKVELVYEVKGAFRKHLTVIEDEDGLIRIYNPIGQEDRLGVRTSRDGVHFDIPEISTIEPDFPNIVTTDSVGTPSVFIDPLAPPAERWKLVSGTNEQGIFLFTSPDGYAWTKCPTAALSSWSGSQSNMFYDDQKGAYVGYHRTDIGETVHSRTERRFVMTEVKSLAPPWPFQALTQADYDRVGESTRLDRNRPWFLDNGPLTPGGIGIEYPTVFALRDGFDPDSTDIYVPKAVKYPWAPDTYLAFPCVYYHYEEGPAGRRALGTEEQARGSGPLEIQLMSSRNGVDWSRHPRPVWLNVGRTDGLDIHQNYIAHGMVRRGDEIWMYSYNTEEYHSGRKSRPDGRRGVFRTVNRLDRFVAAEAPYDEEGLLMSRPLIFDGRRLSLNVDTGATGFLQVGLVAGDGRPLEGYGLDDCIYVNGNDLDATVQWLDRGSDLSALAGQPVRLIIRMRGARLFALQFAD